MKFKYIPYILFLTLLIIYAIINNRNVQRKKNILVMFSGGLDSTTSLYKLLKYTNHNIYAHHIKLKDNSNRWVSESLACDKMIIYLKNIRDFNYTQSEFYLPLNSTDKLGGSRDDDNTNILFVASKIFTVEAYKNIDHIVISNLKCELDNKTINFNKNFLNLMHSYKWSSKKPTLIDPLKEFYCKKCDVSNNNISILNDYIKTIKIVENKNTKFDNNLIRELICSKKKMYNFLPKFLKSNIVYCRNPNNSLICNKCFNCLLYKNVII